MIVKRCYIALLLIFVKFSLSGCTSTEEKMQTMALKSLRDFYSGDLITFKKNLDSMSIYLINSLIPGNSLSFGNTYEVYSLPSQKQSFETGVLQFLRRKNAQLFDTISLTIKPNGNDYEISLDEGTLYKLLKHENELCTQIAKTFFRQKDSQAAFNWFQQAAMQNNAEAKYYLGLLYASNMELNEAIKQFQAAYDQGYSKALTQLTSSYAMSGNKERAIQILKEEAGKDNAEAMVELGHYYNTPSPPNDATANSTYSWYKKAAEKGNLIGMYSLGLLFEGRSRYDSAFYWYSKAASLGENLSMRQLAHFYIEGLFVQKDFNKGWKWLEQAAKINKGLANLDMGDIYRYGTGVKINKVKALEYYKAAAKEGLKVAEMNVKELEKELKE